MHIQLRFFASLREALGTAQESVILPTDVTTLGALRTHLQARGGAWADALAEGKSLRMALNQQMAEASTSLVPGAEVAFFPPVTGG